ncbi:4-carboxymuconolactone decarboxylase [Paracoccus jeotgali]|uniref:4-carboxymuconolactone decarboxylase n=1 Tax=Paracoccus jeotgali TaxID=2065379 RepID=A0A2K9MGV2_9RHOB|nr:4-carboxymuconolactone decarboxylase [Paracoccus jeotgali]AUM74879.1 4-carboxymuconolactone decarboxylase [Paracoccus jeotgali]
MSEPHSSGAALSDRHARGMQVRREVLGDAHVDRAQADASDFDGPFQDLITRAAWGTVWASDGISRRERSMLTLALLAATGNFEEIPMHVRATARTGASRRDILEAFQHVAIYAGVPRANHALKLAKQTYAQMDADSDALSTDTASTDTARTGDRP